MSTKKTPTKDKAEKVVKPRVRRSASIPELDEVSAPLGVDTVPESFGYLGLAKIKIMKIEKYVFDGREYNKVTLANNTTESLSDRDLAAQLSK